MQSHLRSRVESVGHWYEVAVRSQVLPDRLWLGRKQKPGPGKMCLIAGYEMDAEAFGKVRTLFPAFMSLFGCKYWTSVSLEPKRGDACWVFTRTRACRHVFWCWSVHKCGLSEVHSFICTVVKVTGKDKRKKQIPDIVWMFQAQSLRDSV